jgi:hypothetical protein
MGSPARADEPPDAPPRASRKDTPTTSTFGGLSANALIGRTNSSSGNDPLGARMSGAVRVVDALTLGGELTMDTRGQSEMGFEGTQVAQNHSSGRVGLLVGWGAPWNDGIVGVYAASGMHWAHMDLFNNEATRPLLRYSADSFCIYAAASIVAQWPTRTALRPWVGLTGAYVANEFGESSQFFTFDAGIAWRAR